MSGPGVVWLPEDKTRREKRQAANEEKAVEIVKTSRYQRKDVFEEPRQREKTRTRHDETSPFYLSEHVRHSRPSQRTQRRPSLAPVLRSQAIPRDRNRPPRRRNHWDGGRSPAARLSRCGDVGGGQSASLSRPWRGRLGDELYRSARRRDSGVFLCVCVYVCMCVCVWVGGCLGDRAGDPFSLPLPLSFNSHLASHPPRRLSSLSLSSKRLPTHLYLLVCAKLGTLRA